MIHRLIQLPAAVNRQWIEPCFTFHSFYNPLHAFKYSLSPASSCYFLDSFGHSVCRTENTQLRRGDRQGGSCLRRTHTIFFDTVFCKEFCASWIYALSVDLRGFVPSHSSLVSFPSFVSHSCGSMILFGLCTLNLCFVLQFTVVA